MPESIDRQWIKESEYVAHLGEHRDFEDLISQSIDESYRRNEAQVAFV